MIMIRDMIVNGRVTVQESFGGGNVNAMVRGQAKAGEFVDTMIDLDIGFGGQRVSYC